MSSAATTLEIRPLSPAIGVEILGVDLANPIDDAAFARIRRAWEENCIALFRGQTLDEEAQVAFAARFGPLGRIVNETEAAKMGHHPAVLYVSNIRVDGKLTGILPDGEMFFHSDQCYLETPPAGTMLYGIEIPSAGGNTLFAGMYAAYEALLPAMQARLEGLQALNAYVLGDTRRGKMSPDALRFVHPVVRVHPATGRKALYVNRLMTQNIVGLPDAESEALLEELFDHQEQQRFVYEHVWHVGDVILWDNRCALHARTDFDPGERRLLRRITVLREHAA